MNGKYTDDGRDLFLLREYREEEAEHMALRMLESYAPKGLLPVRFRREAGKIKALYRVSGLLPLTEVMKGTEQERALRAVLAALSDIGPTLQTYFLSPQNLSLEASEIFLDSEESVYFLYLLSSERRFQQSLQSMMEFFLRQMNPREDRVLLLYGLYQKSREETVVSDTLFRYYQEWERRNAAEEGTFGAKAEALGPGLDSFASASDSFDSAPGSFRLASGAVNAASGSFGSAPEADSGAGLPMSSAGWRNEEKSFYSFRDEATAPYNTFEDPSSRYSAFDYPPARNDAFEIPSFRYDPSGKMPDRTAVSDESVPDGHVSEAPFAAQTDPDPFREKLKEFLKKHRYDLLIALIVIIGIILFILV